MNLFLQNLLVYFVFPAAFGWAMAEARQRMANPKIKWKS
jgi:hypothetical protein